MSVGRRALLGTLVILVLAAASFFAFRSRNGEVKYVTATADRGDIVDVVGATGVLQAVTTVQVGSQVSGIIQSLGADFNSIVKKGQVVARLDPSTFEARVAQNRANLVAARANVDRVRATLDDARQKYERAQELAAENLLPRSDLETAKANLDGAVAQLKASEAAVAQAEANLNQAQVDLAHTVITAPIDGVVINRSVDVGQTVAASFQAPVLFVIANDLSRMQVNASIDEADIGRVRAGQDVTFRVDAYPDRTFEGKVEQVRLQPITSNNVVTYNTIISVTNDESKLMPGMTATVSLIVQKSANALRIPASALRFRPEGFVRERRPGSPAATTAAGETPAGGRTAGADRPRSARGGASANGAPSASRGSGRGSGNGDGQGRGSPAEGGDGRRALIFALDAQGKPKPTPLRIGISDGQFVEVREGLEEGARVITGIEGGGGSPVRAGPSPSANPFNPQFQQRRR